MSGLRPIFISLYPAFLVAASFYAGLKLYGEPEGPLAWWGVLLTAAPFLILLLRATILRDLARTSRRLPVISSSTSDLMFGGPSHPHHVMSRINRPWNCAWRPAGSRP